MNKNKISAFGHLLSRIFNVAPHEISRIILAWSVRFFFQIGFVIGWTMLTAMLVGRLGIGYLPLLFVANAGLVILSTIFFNRLVGSISRNALIYSTVITGVILLTTAIIAFNTTESLRVFFGLALVAEAVFFAQLNIILSLFTEDLFSPLESARAFPLVETAEYLGGVTGGLLILGALRILNFTTAQLTFIWIGAAILILPILFFSKVHQQKLPSLPVRKAKTAEISRLRKILEGGRQIRRIPFLTGLVFVVLLQWTFFTVLNFNYIKAVDSKTRGIPAVELQSADPLHQSALTEHHEHEELLTHGLGTLHIIFYSLALLTQLFLTSRIIGRFGIVKTLRLHPLISFFSALVMMFKFGFGSAVAARGLFESTTGIYNAAYHSSFYALREKVREHAKEFLEGLIRPLGVIFGTSILLGLQYAFTGETLIRATNLTLVIAAFAMSWILWRSREQYTSVSEKNLRLLGDNPEKLNSIEILAQPGHKNSADILLRNLFSLNERGSEISRIKILEALGRLRNSKTIPGILACFNDKSSAVKLAAINALAKFKNLNSQKFSQAFTRHRAISELQKLFRKENSQEIRSAIINIFAQQQPNEIIPFLLKTLKKANNALRADCIHACGLFKDVSAAHYIEPYLKSRSPEVRSSAIIALWQFSQYRLRLTTLLAKLLICKSKKVQKMAIHTLGEIKAWQEKPRLLHFMQHEDPELRLLTALALAKLNYEKVVPVLAEFILHADTNLSETARKHMDKIPRKIRKAVEKSVHHKLSQKLHNLTSEMRVSDLTDFPKPKLLELRSIYVLADDWKEVSKIDSLISASVKIEDFVIKPKIINHL